MALERLFRRNKPTRKEDDTSPAGLWLKCDNCHAQIYRKDLVANLHVCPECGFHHRMPVGARIELLADEGTFERWSGGIKPLDPLEFEDTQAYTERIEKAQKKSDNPDAIVTGAALLAGQPIGLVLMDFSFMAGSMGSVVGEEIARAAERAAAENRSLVVVTASGGARMQEGALSLMQMAKTTVALSALAEKRLPYVAVLTDPTTGGVTASFATLGDVIFAEPGALISFAGPRVIQQTIRQDLPEGFQRSEFLLQKGMVDDVVVRRELKARVAAVLRLLTAGLPEKGVEALHAATV
ncbi:MAG: acetyl-CoA carboxylase, carboxyltransferase subunit beta [Trueperaceae bacterium]